MDVEKSGGALDWLQRGQALYTAMHAIKPYVLPSMIALVAAFLRWKDQVISPMQWSSVFLAGLYGFAGALIVIAAIRRMLPATSKKSISQAGDKAAAKEMLIHFNQEASEAL